jgi:hypothetical protein
VVRAVCQISKLVAIQYYKEIKGVKPSAGLLPYDPEWIMKSPENCLHASVYHNIYISLINSTRSSKKYNDVELLVRKCEVYLAAYTLYEQTISGVEAVLNVNRAWHITQQISILSIVGKTCTHCGAVHASVKDFPVNYKLCPVCQTYTDLSGRLKWRQPVSMTRSRAPNKKKPILS